MDPLNPHRLSQQDPKESGNAQLGTVGVGLTAAQSVAGEARKLLGTDPQTVQIGLRELLQV